MSAPSRIMAHMVASFPDRAASLDVARALFDGGCAYLELQFPFSDPPADGPDIQKACAAALAAGFTVSDGFRLAAEICSSARAPVFIMSYANLLFTRGIPRFLRETKEAGAAGVIVPDLPPDYDEGLFAAAAKERLSAMPVLSPSIRRERLQRVTALGADHIYATLRLGTTGAVTTIDQAGLGFLSAIADQSKDRSVKIFGGFGVTKRDQVTALEQHVHAVVVGSALVREVAGSQRPFAAVRDRVAALAGGR